MTEGNRSKSGGRFTSENRPKTHGDNKPTELPTVSKNDPIFNVDVLRSILERMQSMTMEGLLLYMRDKKKCTVMESVVGGILISAMKGNTRGFEVLMNRCYGAVKHNINLTGGATQAAVSVVVSLPSNGREVSSFVQRPDIETTAEKVE